MAAAHPDLTGSSWRVEDIGGRAVLDQPATTIRFDPPGQVAGSGGCNRYFGPVTIKANTITFGDLGSTMMACPAPILDQEQRFHAALAAARSFQIDTAGQLVLLEADGTPLVRLRRIKS